jgi:hypothetical protein
MMNMSEGDVREMRELCEKERENVSGREKKEEKMKGKLMGWGLYPSFLSYFLHPQLLRTPPICFFCEN